MTGPSSLRPASFALFCTSIRTDTFTLCCLHCVHEMRLRSAYARGEGIMLIEAHDPVRNTEVVD